MMPQVPNKWTGGTTAWAQARELGIDVGVDKYALLCTTHATITGTGSKRYARKLARRPELWCEACQAIAQGGDDAHVPGYPPGYFTD